MFTIYYFIILKVARSVGLRICSSFRIWWECPWAKSRTKERNERRRTGWHIPVQSASWVRSLVCLNWHVPLKTSGAQSAATDICVSVYGYAWHSHTFIKVIKKIFTKNGKTISIFIKISIEILSIYIHPFIINIKK